MYQNKFYTCLERFSEVGYAAKYSHPIVYVTELPGVSIGELVYFETGQLGIVMTIDEVYTKVLTLSADPVVSNTRVSRSGSGFLAGVGKNLLGKIINPLGVPLESSETLIEYDEYRDIDAMPGGVEVRSRITESLETGVSVVDLLTPLGRGQRELLLGERNTGKTKFALQILENQAKKGAVCIYAGIGKKMGAIKNVAAYLKSKGEIFNNMILMSSFASDPHGLIFITPYVAMTVAEYFRDVGRDVVLVLDDVTTHAKIYREISLISRNLPGKDAYPGDIFYRHSRLLERAGCFKGNNRDVSISCFPIAETLEGEINGFIQTNLMSMTDGRLYFDNEIYKSGRFPAVNYHLSVTRVGRQTQTPLRWSLSRELFSFLILFRKTEKFVHFGAEINMGIKSTLQMNEYITSFLNQKYDEIYPLDVQILTLTAIWAGYLKNDVPDFMKKCVSSYTQDKNIRDSITNLINSSNTFNDILLNINKSRGLLDVIWHQ